MKQLQGLPRINGHWLYGSAKDIAAAPHRFAARVALDNGGMARFHIMRRSFVACASVEAIRHVLVQRHENYPRSFHHRNGSIVLGSGLLTNEGDEWLMRRRQILPAFKNHSLRHLCNLAVEETQHLLDEWETLRRDESPIPVLPQMQKITLSVIARALLSTRITAEEQHTFGLAIRDSLRLVRARNISPLVWPMWVPTQANKKLVQVRSTLDEFVDRHLQAREALPEDQWPDDILTLLMKARDPDTGAKLSREALRDETKTLFVAGFETTAGALTWCLYLLAKHPEAAKRWRDEVDEVLNGAAPDEARLSELKFTSCVVHEALRLYPTVYNLGRVALQDDKIGGHQIRRGEIMLISIFGVHRNPGEWEAPDEFRPQRFENAWNRLAFMPFAAGKHQCIGNSFAHMEIMTALAMIAQRFEISLPPDFTAGESAFITLTPDREIPLQLKRR